MAHAARVAGCESIARRCSTGRGKILREDDGGVAFARLLYLVRFFRVRVHAHIHVLGAEQYNQGTSADTRARREFYSIDARCRSPFAVRRSDLALSRVHFPLPYTHAFHFSTQKVRRRRERCGPDTL